MNLNDVLGFNIKKLRIERSMSFSELDRKSWIDRSYLHRLERGEKNPTLDKIQDLASAFEVPAHTLLEVPREHIKCCAVCSPAPGPCDCGLEALLNKKDETPNPS